METTYKTREDIGRLILRLLIGGLLLFHGISKIIHGVAWMAGPLSALHLPGFIAYGVYVGEVVAPILLILGILSRAAGLVVSVDLLMAVILVAHTRLFTVSAGGGWGVELEAMFFFGGLAVFFFGAGRFSIGGEKGFWN